LRSLKADESFFKIPITFRIKTEDSIIEKAFYRSKGYKDPYEQITDKIGGRVVVLLEEHTNGVCKVIESIEGFTFSKDKDFEKQRDENPELFLYQSHHYILRNTEKIFYAGIEVPVNTPAEIQIRTLLQHAYSELTHDTIYKPNTVASPEIKRYVAKSMALIEVTDSIFSKVHESLRYSEQLFSRIIDELNSLMPKEIMAKHDLKFNEHILDIFLTELDIYSFEGVRRFSQEYNFILEKINERSTYKYLYHQPVILFIYWLVSIKRKIVRAKWPLDFRDLEEIFIDLGYSFEKM
jgi:ppGpp synthetase/RelA/SpoT-type nucleotidyltranferase